MGNWPLHEFDRPKQLMATFLMCRHYILIPQRDGFRSLGKRGNRKVCSTIKTEGRTRTLANSLEQVFFLGMVVLLAFLIWRCRFGFADIDECFYLTVPYRICQGDKIMLHEWHGTQLSLLLLVPFMKAFLMLSNGTNGIMFAFRIIYTIVWWIASVFFYFRLRRFSIYGAILASLCFLLFAPYGIIALSYNSMGLLLFLTAGILMAFCRGKLRLVLVGFLFAGAVLCCPYLAFPWVCFCLASLIDRLFLHSIPKGYWLYTTIGIGIAFLAFCLLLLFNAPAQEYMETLPLILDDPEHPMIPLLEKVQLIIYYARQLNPYWFGFVLFSLAVILQTKLSKTFCLGFSVTCGAIIALLLSYRGIYHLSNFSMFPLSLLGLFCAACSKDSEIRKLFFSIWLPGLAFSFCSGFSSNQAYFAFSSASTVMTVASILMAVRFLAVQIEDGTNKSKRVLIMILVFSITVTVQISCEFIDRYRNVFWDEAGEIANQTIRAEEGPEKGIWMNSDAYEFYMITQNDLRGIIEDSSIKNVLFLSKNTWLYLSAEKDNASYSAWLSGVNDHTMYRLKQYYQMFPEKIPEVVFFDRDYANFIPLFETLGYHRSEEPTSKYAFILRKEIT